VTVASLMLENPEVLDGTGFQWVELRADSDSLEKASKAGVLEKLVVRFPERQGYIKPQEPPVETMLVVTWAETEEGLPATEEVPRSQLVLKIPSVLPDCKDPWDDLTPDDVQGLIAKCGLGQVLLGKSDIEEADVMCDTSLLATLKDHYRDSFEPLGVVAYFKVGTGSTVDGGKWTLSAMRWYKLPKDSNLIYPGSEHWDHAKFVWRSSILAQVTMVHHLAWTHWVSANSFSTAIREALPPNHPIRRVLHVNAFRTAKVNFGSFKTLYPEDGFLHRMSPLKYTGLTAAFDAAVKQYRFRPWPEYLSQTAKELGQDVADSLPMFQDGIPLYNAMKEFYSQYVAVYYASDEDLQADAAVGEYWQFRCAPQYRERLHEWAEQKVGTPCLTRETLSTHMAQVVFDVTAWHEFVGNVIGYVADPAGAALQVRPGHNMADLQQVTQMLSLVASTGAPMPMFGDDWSRLLDLRFLSEEEPPIDPAARFTKMYTEEVKATVEGLHTELRDKLHKVSQLIEANNDRRANAEGGVTRPFRQFDPKYLECSVSL